MGGVFNFLFIWLFRLQLQIQEIEGVIICVFGIMDFLLVELVSEEFVSLGLVRFFFIQIMQEVDVSKLEKDLKLIISGGKG